jgi:hypothetical protein
MSLHNNDGDCQYCNKIFDRYPNFYVPLRKWFKDFQKLHPEAHISCAGRGRQDQEEAFIRKASRAHYGQSSHNVNAAIDIFELQGNPKDIYERSWFDKVLAPALLPELVWYGAPNAPFKELPHVEVRSWKELRMRGILKLVE